MDMITTQDCASQNTKIIRKLRAVLRCKEWRSDVWVYSNDWTRGNGGPDAAVTRRLVYQMRGSHASGSGFVSDWDGSAGTGSGSSLRGDGVIGVCRADVCGLGWSWLMRVEASRRRGMAYMRLWGVLAGDFEHAKAGYTVWVDNQWEATSEHAARFHGMSPDYISGSTSWVDSFVLTFVGASYVRQPILKPFVRHVRRCCADLAASVTQTASASRVLDLAAEPVIPPSPTRPHLLPVGWPWWSTPPPGCNQIVESWEVNLGLTVPRDKWYSTWPTNPEDRAMVIVHTPLRPTAWSKHYLFFTSTDDGPVACVRVMSLWFPDTVCSADASEKHGPHITGQDTWETTESEKRKGSDALDPLLFSRHASSHALDCAIPGVILQTQCFDAFREQSNVDQVQIDPVESQ
ncbi:hypothetical protein JB92DRAFT_2830693 [Gautieria morchelliformis]|nr:hypothetical protein JB92DRAFT_2830693 [Gautieria morchelliformis]